MLYRESLSNDEGLTDGVTLSLNGITMMYVRFTFEFLTFIR